MSLQTAAQAIIDESQPAIDGYQGLRIEKIFVSVKLIDTLRAELALTEGAKQRALDSQEFHERCMDYRGASFHVGHAASAFVRLQQWILDNV